MPDEAPRPGFDGLSMLQSLAKPGPMKTILVALVVSLACSVLVSSVAIALRPKYVANLELNRQQNVLAAAGLLRPGADVAALFEQVEARTVDLETGAYADDVGVAQLDPQQALRDPGLHVPIPRELDIALIGNRPKYREVYLVHDADRLELIILPVYGTGLWSTMYGYLALESDANTIAGLRFYQHGETPGLGGQIDSPRWLRLWPGKRIYAASGKPLIEVVKGAGGTAARADFQVDSITGATLTGNGVTNLLRYWLGDHAFGPYLTHIRNAQAEG